MSLVEHLGERGYRISEWNSVLVRPLTPGERFDTGTIEVQRIKAEERWEWANAVLRGLGDQPGITAEVMLPVATAPSAMCFLARIDGQPAGGAAGSLFPQHGIAPFYAASTAPEFRNRGVQNALLRARVQAAAEAGCRLAVVCMEPGTVSQRNAERNGFRVAYTKVAMQRRL
jgi:GNAT superfamily N-acetyltransferase